LAHTLDTDAAFERHAKRNAGGDGRPCWTAWRWGSILCQGCHGNGQQDRACTQRFSTPRYRWYALLNRPEPPISRYLLGAGLTPLSC
jgi:hypothetical protein